LASQYKDVRRVLHIVKTSDGADWAADQAAELSRLGIEIHVVLPRGQGRTVQKWMDGGAIIHIVPTDLPIRSPWLLAATARRLRALVSDVRPDIIHSHFFGSTVLLRLALGADHGIPRLFQVPGPLHLEHRFWRAVDLLTAGACDSWIASSCCILSHYESAGVSKERLYLSYYGTQTHTSVPASVGLLHKRYSVPDCMKIVGNANFIYPPKWFLGQRFGLKAHEDVIDALGLVVRERSDVMGVLIGGTFKGSQWYERRLRARARAVGKGRILMTGYLPMNEIRQMWGDFDVAVHVPTSENCGGVIEPLLANVPVIAGRVGGLPEVVVDGITGTLVGIRDPQALARAVVDVLDFQDRYRPLARSGHALVDKMFDVRRTASEVFDIYRHILDARFPRPHAFDSVAYLHKVSDSALCDDRLAPQQFV
jgi:glycosyltransferase involved in cell wall biosynthesis